MHFSGVGLWVVAGAVSGRLPHCVSIQHSAFGVCQKQINCEDASVFAEIIHCTLCYACGYTIHFSAHNPELTFIITSPHFMFHSQTSPSHTRRASRKYCHTRTHFDSSHTCVPHTLVIPIDVTLVTMVHMPDTVTTAVDFNEVDDQNVLITVRTRSTPYIHPRVIGLCDMDTIRRAIICGHCNCVGAQKFGTHRTLQSISDNTQILLLFVSTVLDGFPWWDRSPHTPNGWRHRSSHETVNVITLLCPYCQCQVQPRSCFTCHFHLVMRLWHTHTHTFEWSTYRWSTSERQLDIIRACHSAGHAFLPRCFLTPISATCMRCTRLRLICVPLCWSSNQLVMLIPHADKWYLNAMHPSAFWFASHSVSACYPLGLLSYTIDVDVGRTARTLLHKSVHGFDAGTKRSFPIPVVVVIHLLRFTIWGSAVLISYKIMDTWNRQRHRGWVLPLFLRTTMQSSVSTTTSIDWTCAHDAVYIHIARNGWLLSHVQPIAFTPRMATHQQSLSHPRLECVDWVRLSKSRNRLLDGIGAIMEYVRQV